MGYKYKKICLGGTFDVHSYDGDIGVHCGHKEFFKHASWLAPELYIGLRDDKSLKMDSRKKFPDLIKPYRERERNLKRELKELGVERYKIVRLKGVYTEYMLKKNCDIDAILVTKETLRGAEIINKEKRRRGLRPLAVEIIPLKLAEDEKTKISSKYIRGGEMTPEGKIITS